MRLSVSWRVSKAEYSAWTASIFATGVQMSAGSVLVFTVLCREMNVLCGELCVLEFALRSVAAEHSERPMYLVLPAARIESRAGMDCSRGVSCCFPLVDRRTRRRKGHTGVDAVEVIEIWRKAQTLDRAFDVRFDVLGGVGDGAVFESGETAFGGNYGCD